MSGASGTVAASPSALSLDAGGAAPQADSDEGADVPVPTGRQPLFTDVLSEQIAGDSRGADQERTATRGATPPPSAENPRPGAHSLQHPETITLHGAVLASAVAMTGTTPPRAAPLGVTKGTLTQAGAESEQPAAPRTADEPTDRFVGPARPDTGAMTSSDSDDTGGGAAGPSVPGSSPPAGAPVVDGTSRAESNGQMPSSGPAADAVSGTAHGSPPPGAGAAGGAAFTRSTAGMVPNAAGTLLRPTAGPLQHPPAATPTDQRVSQASAPHTQNTSPGSSSAALGSLARASGATTSVSSSSVGDQVSEPLDVEGLAGSISRPLESGAGNYTVVVAMHPPDLGHLQAVLSLDGNDLEVSITPQTQAGHDALSTAAAALRDQLSHGGVNVNVTLRDPRSQTGADDRYRSKEPDGGPESADDSTSISPRGSLLSAGQIHLVL